MATKAKKRKVAPCNKCKGFTVPGRRVKTVARAANGRFKRAGK
jgi:hypothetical protein